MAAGSYGETVPVGSGGRIGCPSTVRGSSSLGGCLLGGGTLVGGTGGGETHPSPAHRTAPSPSAGLGPPSPSSSRPTPPPPRGPLREGDPPERESVAWGRDQGKGSAGPSRPGGTEGRAHLWPAGTQSGRRTTSRVQGGGGLWDATQACGDPRGINCFDLTQTHFLGGGNRGQKRNTTTNHEEDGWGWIGTQLRTSRRHW